jgi:molybdate transport system substrate-binding protein
VQGYVITRRAANNPVAKAFAAFVDSPAAKKILQHYGFADAPASAH